MARRKAKEKKRRSVQKQDNPIVAFLLLAIILLVLYIAVTGPRKERLAGQKPLTAQKSAAKAQTQIKEEEKPLVKPVLKAPEKKPLTEQPKPKTLAKVQVASVQKVEPQAKPTQKAKAVLPLPALALAQQKGKIAIIIDDWGYSLNTMALVDEIKQHFTAAVLPNLSSSRKVAQALHDRGVEVILHLPLEPKDKLNLEKDTIMVSSTEPVIRGIVDNDLASVVVARGVSNHMGSEATRDAKTMEIIFDELKKKNLFFLDSYVLSESVCQEEAAKAGIRFARRDIFLDNDSDPAYIRNQMAKLKKEAEVKGSAIGIGHDRKATLEVLKELMPEYEQEGYRFVFVSELTK